MDSYDLFGEDGSGMLEGLPELGGATDHHFADPAVTARNAPSSAYNSQQQQQQQQQQPIYSQATPLQKLASFGGAGSAGPGGGGAGGGPPTSDFNHHMDPSAAQNMYTPHQMGPPGNAYPHQRQMARPPAPPPAGQYSTYQTAADGGMYSMPDSMQMGDAGAGMQAWGQHAAPGYPAAAMHRYNQMRGYQQAQQQVQQQQQAQQQQQQQPMGAYPHPQQQQQEQKQFPTAQHPMMQQPAAYQMQQRHTPHYPGAGYPTAAQSQAYAGYPMHQRMPHHHQYPQTHHQMDMGVQQAQQQQQYSQMGHGQALGHPPPHPGLTRDQTSGPHSGHMGQNPHSVVQQTHPSQSHPPTQPPPQQQQPPMPHQVAMGYGQPHQMQPMQSAPQQFAQKHGPGPMGNASPQYRAPFPQLSPQMSPRPPQMSPRPQQPPQMSPRPVMSPAKPNMSPHHVMQQTLSPRPTAAPKAAGASPQAMQAPYAAQQSTLQALEQMVMPPVSTNATDYPAYQSRSAMGMPTWPAQPQRQPPVSLPQHIPNLNGGGGAGAMGMMDPHAQPMSMPPTQQNLPPTAMPPHTMSNVVQQQQQQQQQQQPPPPVSLSNMGGYDDLRNDIKSVVSMAQEMPSAQNQQQIQAQVQQQQQEHAQIVPTQNMSHSTTVQPPPPPQPQTAVPPPMQQSMPPQNMPQSTQNDFNAVQSPTTSSIPDKVLPSSTTNTELNLPPSGPPSMPTSHPPTPTPTSTTDDNITNTQDISLPSNSDSSMKHLDELSNASNSSQQPTQSQGNSSFTDFNCVSSMTGSGAGGGSYSSQPSTPKVSKMDDLVQSNMSIFSQDNSLSQESLAESNKTETSSQMSPMNNVNTPTTYTSNQSVSTPVSPTQSHAININNPQPAVPQQNTMPVMPSQNQMAFGQAPPPPPTAGIYDNQMISANGMPAVHMTNLNHPMMGNMGGGMMPVQPELAAYQPPISHQQERAALQQQLQELYCMPPAPEHQEKIGHLQERLNALSQHEANEQCNGGAQCILQSPLFQTPMIDSPQVTSTTGRGRGKSAQRSKKPRQKKGDKLEAAAQGLEMPMPMPTPTPPQQLPVSEDFVTPGTGTIPSAEMTEIDLGIEPIEGEEKKKKGPRKPRESKKNKDLKSPKPVKERKKREPKEEKEPKLKRKYVRKKKPNDESEESMTAATTDESFNKSMESSIDEVPAPSDAPATTKPTEEDSEAADKVVTDSTTEEVSTTPAPEKDDEDKDKPEADSQTPAADSSETPTEGVGEAPETNSETKKDEYAFEDQPSPEIAELPKRSKKSRPAANKRVVASKARSRGGSGKSRKRRGGIVPESDGENDDIAGTPPPSPPEEENSTKRRSARNTQRKKYIDDVMLRFSDDDTPVAPSKSKKSTVPATPPVPAASTTSNSGPEESGSKEANNKMNYVYVNTTDEDTMVVQHILSSRMGKRPKIIPPPPPPPEEAKTGEDKEKVEEDSEKTEEAKEDGEEPEKKDEGKKNDIENKTEDEASKKNDEDSEEKHEESKMDVEYSKKDFDEDKKDVTESKKDVAEESKNETEDSEKKDEETKLDNDEIKKETEETEKIEKDNEITEEASEELKEASIKDEDGPKINEDSKEKDNDANKPDEDAKIDATQSKESESAEESKEGEEKTSSDAKPEGEADEQEMIEVEEFYVKYRNFSYLHCEWRTEDELYKGDKRIGNKIKRFKQKQAQQMNIFENLEDEPFNPDYTEVDRVLDASEHKDPTTNEVVKHYLVKWRSLQYEDCTWELEEDVDPIKIQQFEKWRQVPPRSEWKPKKRPSPDQWKQLDASPIYKGGNVLREYQLEGLNWLVYSWYNTRNCILADEMGLGKTIQSLTFIHAVWEFGIRGPFLVIAPLSTIPNWQREIESWTDMNVIVYHGSAASRNMIQEYEMYYKNDRGQPIKDLTKFNILITTFEIIVTDFADLKSFNWRLCVIDEAHRLKNRNCKLLEGLRQLNLEHRVLLSGTPLQNNVNELFSLLNFLEPQQFPSSDAFVQEFGQLKSEQEVQKLQCLLKPMMLRRLKEDVEKSLAPKEETVVEVELTNIQKKYYRGILERNFSFLSKGTTHANIPNLMNTMMELRKCCIHPYLLNGAEEQIQYDYKCQHGEDPDAYYKALIHSSGKMVLIDKLLPKLKANGHRVLIFSQMVRCLDILEDYLVFRKYPFERIDGRIRGNLRQAAIDRFSRPDSDRFVFLLCTKAGGLGINLTAADTVIIYDSDWNPQNDLQAQARCHRIGQQKMVKIYRLLCRNTYEREMFDKASLKLGLDKAILQSMNTSQGGKDSGNKQLSKKEIEDLLKKGAYGALLDEENDGDKFCEEDIDVILARRTQVITMESEKGSTFSKASFASSANRSDINIDDPDFWNKWAKKADIDTTEKDESEDLVISEPRRRTQIKRYGHDESAIDMSELESSSDSDNEVEGIGLSMRSRRNKLKRKRLRDEYMPREGSEIVYGSWARRECFMVERGLLTFGWGRWTEILQHSQLRKGWKEQDIEDCARVILLYCLRFYRGDEKIRSFIWDLIAPSENGEQKISRNHHGLKDPVPRGIRNKNKNKKGNAAGGGSGGGSGKHAAITDPNHWSKNEKYDGDIFLENNYKKHLGRHANKVLLRVRMLYYIKHEIIGDLVQHIADGVHASALPIYPPVTEQLPSVWWDTECDKSLLVGTWKHGYENYPAMRADPTLCFLSRCGPPTDCELQMATSNTQPPTPAPLNDDEMEEEDEETAKAKAKDSATNTVATSTSVVDVEMAEPSPGPSASSDATQTIDLDDKTMEDAASTTSASAASAAGGGDAEKNQWPTITDLNTRLRRVITSYQRSYRKEEQKMTQSAAAAAAAAASVGTVAQTPTTSKVSVATTTKPSIDTTLSSSASPLAALAQVSQQFDLKDAAALGLQGWDLQQLALYLLKMERQGKQAMDQALRDAKEKEKLPIAKRWTKREEADFFRVASSFGVVYYRKKKMYDWMKFKQLAKLEKKSDDDLTDYYKNFLQMCKKQASLNVDEASYDTTIEHISEEKARRTLERLDILSRIREEILTHPKLDERLKLCLTSADMPEWWIPGKHDKDLLLGVAKHGLGRTDYYLLNDPDLSFQEVLKKKVISNATDVKDAIKLESHEDILKFDKDEILVKLEKGEGTLKIEKVAVKKEAAVEEKVKPVEEEKVKLTIVKNEKCEEEAKSAEKEEKTGEEDKEKENKEKEDKEMEDKQDKSEDKLEENPEEKTVEEKDVKEAEKMELDNEKLEIDKEKEKEKEDKKDEPQEAEKETEENQNKDEDKKIEIEDTELEKKKSDCAEDKNKNEEKAQEKPNDKLDEKEKNVEENKLEESEVKDEDKKVENAEKLEETDKIEKISSGESKDEKSPEESLDKSKKIEEPKEIEEKSKEIKEKSTEIDDQATEKEPEDIKKPEETESKEALPKTEEIAVKEVKEVEKLDADLCSKQAAELKAMFPDLEVIQPLSRLSQVDTFVLRDKPASGAVLDFSETTVAQMFNNAVKWPKDYAIQVRLQHIIYAVETKEWPVTKAFSAYATGIGNEIDIPVHELPNDPPKRETSTPMSVASDDVLIVNERNLMNKKRKRHIAIDVETERAKLHALLNSSHLTNPMSSAKHGGMSAWAENDNDSEDSRRSTPVTAVLQPPPAHQHQSTSSRMLNMPFDLKYHAPAAKTIGQTTVIPGTSSTLTPIDLSSSIPKSMEKSASVGLDLSEVQDFSIKKSSGTGLKSTGNKLDDTLSKLMKRKNCPEPEPVIGGKEKKRRKLDEIVLGLSAAKEQSLIPETTKKPTVTPSVTVTPTSAPLSTSHNLTQKPFTITVTSVPSPAASSSRGGAGGTSGTSLSNLLPSISGSSKDTFSSFLAQAEQQNLMLKKQQEQQRKKYEAMIADLGKSADFSKVNSYSHEAKVNKWLAEQTAALAEQPLSAADYLSPRRRRPRVDPTLLDWKKLTGDENVSVIHRVTGKKLTGPKAPTLKRLGSWLKENPMYDIDPKWSELVKERGNLSHDLQKRLPGSSSGSGGGGASTSGTSGKKVSGRPPLMGSPTGSASQSSQNINASLPANLQFPGLGAGLNSNLLSGLSGLGQFDPKNNPLLMPFAGIPNMSALSSMGGLGNLTNMNLFANLAGLGLPGLGGMDAATAAALSGETSKSSKNSSGGGASTSSASTSKKTPQEAHSSSKGQPGSSSSSSIPTSNPFPFFLPNPSLLYTPLGLGGLNPFTLQPGMYDSLVQQCGLLNGSLPTSASPNSGSSSKMGKSSAGSSGSSRPGTSSSSSSPGGKMSRSAREAAQLQQLLLPPDTQILESITKAASSLDASLKSKAEKKEDKRKALESLRGMLPTDFTSMAKDKKQPMIPGLADFTKLLEAQVQQTSSSSKKSHEQQMKEAFLDQFNKTNELMAKAFAEEQAKLMPSTSKRHREMPSPAESHKSSSMAHNIDFDEPPVKKSKDNAGSASTSRSTTPSSCATPKEVEKVAVPAATPPSLPAAPALAVSSGHSDMAVDIETLLKPSTVVKRSEKVEEDNKSTKKEEKTIVRKSDRDRRAEEREEMKKMEEEKQAKEEKLKAKKQETKVEKVEEETKPAEETTTSTAIAEKEQEDVVKEDPKSEAEKEDTTPPKKSTKRTRGKRKSGELAPIDPESIIEKKNLRSSASRSAAAAAARQKLEAENAQKESEHGSSS